MQLWRTLKGKLMLRFPYTTFVGKAESWGLSFKRYDLVLSSDTTTPYSILHLGPFEFFSRPKSREIDWF